MFLSVTNYEGVAMADRVNSTVTSDTRSSIDHVAVRMLTVNAYYDFAAGSVVSPYLGAGVAAERRWRGRRSRSACVVNGRLRNTFSRRRRWPADAGNDDTGGFDTVAGVNRGAAADCTERHDEDENERLDARVGCPRVDSRLFGPARRCDVGASRRNRDGVRERSNLYPG